MRENLLIGTFTIVFTAGFIWLAAQKQVVKPPEVTPRMLDCDVEFFAGKEVRIKTEGMEPGAIPNECTYRKRADQPPVVICKFKNPIPTKIPAFITGTCIGRQDTAVVIVDCR